MTTSKRLAITLGASVLFFCLFWLTPGFGRSAYINERLRHWQGRSDDWISLAIALGVTLGIAIIVWEKTDS